MLNSKFISLLRTFSKEEVKSFDDYIKSPYFNKREAPIKLYAVLLPYFPDFDNLKPEKAFKKAFPDKPAYSETYLRNVLSDLNELALGFLRQEAADKNKTSGEFVCVYKLIYRKLFKQAEQQLEKIHEWIKKSWAESDYNSLYAEYCEYKMILHDRAEEPLAYSEVHQQKANYWEKAIWEKVFSLIYEMENDKRAYFNYPYNIESFKKILFAFNPDQFTHDPITMAAYYRAMLLASNSWEWWIQLYNHTKTAAQNMPDNQTYTCYLALSNYIDYLSKREKDNIENLSELKLELMQEATALREKNNLHMLEHYYTKMAEIGYTLYGEEWALNFIEQNQHKLLPYLQEALPNYCRAMMWFQAKNYPEAIALFSQLPNFRSDLYFSVKPMLLLAYYETENEEAMEYLFLSFKKTFKNHGKLAQIVQQSLENFITAFAILCKLRLQYNVQQAEQLQTMIDNPGLPLTGKVWMEQKLTEITEKAKRKTKKTYA